MAKVSVLARVGKVVGAGDHLTVIAGKPAPDAVDDSIPPAALELVDDLDHVALMKTQTGSVVGLVVVQSANIHGARRRCPHDAIHGTRGGRIIAGTVLLMVELGLKAVKIVFFLSRCIVEPEVRSSPETQGMVGWRGETRGDVRVADIR